MFDVQIQVTDFSLLIFNRWGSLVFESDDPTHSWQGNYLDDQADPGAYLYNVKVNYIDDEGLEGFRIQGASC